MTAAGASTASAQTVIVKGAPAASNVDFILNTTVVASGTADATGVATLTAPPAAALTQDIEARIWLDVCSDRRRIVVVGRRVDPPSAEACNRMPIEGLFLVRGISSIVIDVGPSVPVLRLRQGRAPREWIVGPTEKTPGVRRPLPTGLVLFGGAGVGRIRDFDALFCGDVAGCSASVRPRVLTAGLTYWFSRFAGAEASYVDFGDISAEGSGTSYRFTSTMQGALVTLAGKGGATIGPVRIYGNFGANYQRSRFTTVETADDLTVTVGDVQQTLPGGSETFQWRTGGWGVSIAGGAEFWFSTMLGAYGQYDRLTLKGGDLGNGEARTDDLVQAVTFGVRVKLPGGP
jgi:hypothetical protein